MKKLAMTLALVAITGLTSGCSHSGWVKFEEQTRVAGFMAAPMGLVNMVGKVGRLVTNDDGMAVCHDCVEPLQETAAVSDK